MQFAAVTRKSLRALLDYRDFVATKHATGNECAAQLRALSWTMVVAVAITVFMALGNGEAQSFDVERSVLTQHNDNERTGWYRAEANLSPSTVTPKTFSELYRLHVSGMISAQPLYVHGLLIGSRRKNILYVATNENHVYGFEIKEQQSTGQQSLAPLLQANFPGAALLPGMLDGPRTATKAPCGQTWWKVGITSTPVIDPTTGTMFLVYRTGLKPGPAHSGAPGPTNYALDTHFWLAELDIRTLNPVRPSVEISASGFAPDMQLNRPALLLSQGIIYVAFGGAVCDYGGNPFVELKDKARGHGWMFAFDASNISRPPATLITTPNTSLGGIWQSGNGLSASGDGVYAMTGNNGIPYDPHAPEFAESLIKLTLSRDQLGKRFQPTLAMLVGNWYRLDTGKRGPDDPAKTDADSDLGAGGPVVIPNGRIIGGGKQGRLYIVDPGTLHQSQAAFQAFYNTWHPETDACDYDKEQKNGPNIHGSPVVWHPSGLNYSLFYGMPEKEYLKGFRAYDDGKVSIWPDLATTESGYRSPDQMPGGFLSISSNGGNDGIVWALVADYDRKNDAAYHTVPGRLIAFDALTLRPLWSDGEKSSINFVKFVPPTIADSKVFRVSYDGSVGADGSTNGTIVIYGPKQQQGSLLSFPLPERRVVTALWDPANQHLNVFTPAADGEVISTFFHAYSREERMAGCTDGWRGWFPMGDHAPASGGASPVTAVWRPNHNRLDLFMVGADGSVKQTFVDNGNWSTEWTPLHPESGKGIPGQPVTAVWRGDGHLDLFITGTDGHVKSIYYDNETWQPAWFSLRPQSGRTVPGQVVSAVWRPGHAHLDLFMTGDDGSIKSIYFENNQWAPAWFTLRSEVGAAAARQPITAVWRDAGHLDLFMTGSDGYVRSIYFESNAWQPSWFKLSPESGKAIPGQAITAVWRPNSKHLDLFMVQNDNSVRSTYFEGIAWLGNWFSLHPETGRAATGQAVTAVWRDERHLDLFISGVDGRVKSIYFESNAWQPSWFPL